LIGSHDRSALARISLLGGKRRRTGNKGAAADAATGKTIKVSVNPDAIATINRPATL